MKSEIIQQLMVVLNALNSIPVSGKTNLANLSGSITVLEDVLQKIEGATLAASDDTDSQM